MSSIVKELLRNYYSIDDISKLDLDTAIASLIDCGELSKEECIVLQLTVDQVNRNDISKMVGWKKSNINIRFNVIANKISNYLGAEYQDDKIIKEVEFKLGRKLTTDEEKFCWKVIKSGRPIDGINIFNFEVGINVTNRGKNKTKG